MRDKLRKRSKLETVCMKGQNLFSRDKKKTVLNWSSAEFAQRLAKVNMSFKIVADDILFFFSVKIRIFDVNHLLVYQLSTTAE